MINVFGHINPDSVAICTAVVTAHWLTGRGMDARAWRLGEASVLADHEFVAGEAFSIADIAHFGWLWRREFAGVSLGNAPNVRRWFEKMAARPAVQRAIERVNALASV